MRLKPSDTSRGLRLVCRDGHKAFETRYVEILSAPFFSLCLPPAILF